MLVPSASAVSRRSLLRGFGVSMALPWLESLTVAAAAAPSAAEQPPTRTLVTFTITPPEGAESLAFEVTRLNTTWDRKRVEPAEPLERRVHLRPGRYRYVAVADGPAVVYGEFEVP